MLNWVSAFALAIGILPSFTALSGVIAHSIPSLARYLGPINLLKVLFPFLFLQIWQNRAILQPRVLQFFGALLLLGTLFTAISAASCHAPPTLLREWAVMVIGVGAAISFTLLPRRQMAITLATWLLFVYGAVACDLLFPQFIDWMYTHLFDPDTRKFDAMATGHRLLSGVWGNQSLAKILSWLPWIALAFGGERLGRRNARMGWFIFSIASTALVLKTSQRGPFIGALCAWIAFALHRYFRFREKKIAVAALVSVLMSVTGAIAIVPMDMLEARFKSMMGYDDVKVHALRAANENVYFRKQMFKLSLDQIATHPFGNACLPDQVYADYGIYPAHSHHLFLQQYRDRGWIWGTLHLLLWLGALALAWRSSKIGSSGLFAGVVCVIVQGQFDQPWFVLNQAMLLGVILFGSLSLIDKAKVRT